MGSAQLHTLMGEVMSVTNVELQRVTPKFQNWMMHDWLSTENDTKICNMHFVLMLIFKIVMQA